MSDIFREVDEDIRRARFEEIWKRYGSVITGVVIIGVLAVAVWQGYQYWRNQQAEGASATYQAAIDASEAGRADEARTQLQGLVAGGPGGYAMLARFRLAADAGKANAEAGAKAYDALAADASLDPTLRDLARLRAAMLLVDTLPLAELQKRLESLLQPGNPWHGLAHELLGLAKLKAGDYEGAGREFDAIVTDPETPAGLRQRVEIYLGIVRAGPLPPAPAPTEPAKPAPTPAAPANEAEPTPTVPAPSAKPAPQEPVPAAPLPTPAGPAQPAPAPAPAPVPAPAKPDQPTGAPNPPTQPTPAPDQPAQAPKQP